MDQVSNTTGVAQGAAADGTTATAEVVVEAVVPDNAGTAATDDVKTFDAEYVARLRQEAAGHRTKHKDAEARAVAAEAKIAAHEAAQLTDIQRLEAERNTYADQAKKLGEQSAQRALDYEAVVLANKLNIVDPDVAVKLLDRSTVEWDDATGRPTNLQSLLEALLEAKPFLKGVVKPVVPNIGATNGAATGRTDSKGGALTLEELNKMPYQEQEKRADEVAAFLASYRGKK